MCVHEISYSIYIAEHKSEVLNITPLIIAAEWKYLAKDTKLETEVMIISLPICVPD